MSEARIRLYGWKSGNTHFMMEVGIYSKLKTLDKFAYSFLASPITSEIKIASRPESERLSPDRALILAGLCVQITSDTIKVTAAKWIKI